MAVCAPDLVGWAAAGSDDSDARELGHSKLPTAPVRTTYALAINEVIIDGSLAVVRDTWTQATRKAAGADQRNDVPQLRGLATPRGRRPEDQPLDRQPDAAGSGRAG